jgi:hypothetical protein
MTLMAAMTQQAVSEMRRKPFMESNGAHLEVRIFNEHEYQA